VTNLPAELTLIRSNEHTAI